jgi:hypothetical protein
MADIKKIIEIEFQVNNSEPQKFVGTLDEVLAKVADVEEAISSIPEAELKLKVDGVDTTTKELKDLANQSKATDKAFDTLTDGADNLGASFADVYGELQPLTTRLGETEDRLYELALAGKQNTDEFRALTAQAGEYRRTQIEVDLAVDSASKTLGQKLAGGLNAAAGGFAIAQGAAGLFGSESEKVEKALLKVQSALAIVQGITAFRENKKDLVNLGKTVTDFSKGLGSTILKVVTFGKASAVAGKEAEVGFSGASKGAKAFSVALTATGIGAIIVGIGVALAVVAAYWDDITAAVSGVSASERESLEKAKANTTEQQRKLDNLNAQDETLKAQGKSEEEILKLKQEQAKKVLDATKFEQAKAKQIRDAEIAQAERNNEILKFVVRAGLEIGTVVLRALALPIDTVIEAVNYASEALGLGKAIDFNINAQITKANEFLAQGAANLVFDVQGLKDEAKKADQEAEAGLIEIQNTVDGYGNQLKDLRKKQGEEAAKAAADLNKKIAEETKRHNAELNKIAEDATKLALEKRKQDAKTLLEQLGIDQQLEMNALKKGYDDQIKAATDAAKEIQKQIAGGKDADGKALSKAQLDALKKQVQNYNDEVVKITANRTQAVTNLEVTQGEKTKDLLDEQLKEQQAYNEEVYGLTLELVNAQSDLENKALAERLKQYGFTEEQIAAIQKKRRDEAGDEFTQNIKKLESDKAYFDELAKLYNDNTLDQEERARKIEALDKKRTADALANELTILKSKQKAGEEETKEYKERAARIAEIEAQQAATSIATTEKTQAEKLDTIQKFTDMALELANSLADLSNALLELETAKLEAEYEKRIEAQQNRNNKLLENEELTVSQREELERQNSIELAKIEEEKQAKLKEIKKKQADIDLAVTISQIVANTALALMRGFSDLGPVGGAVAAAITTAIGAAQIATAIAQRQAIAGLAMGGMVYGMGGPTDDMVPIMASNGEAVINAKAVKRFAPVLSAINESTGGAPIKPRFAAGGVVTANPGEVSVTNINDIAAVAGQASVRAYILDSDVTSQSVKNARLARQARIK